MPRSITNHGRCALLVGLFFAISVLELCAQTTLHVMSTAGGAGTGTLADPFGSIQAAIVAAGPGDTVLVHPGVYVENLDFLGKSIVVEGLSGAVATIVDGNQVDTVLKFLSGEGASSVVKGLTLRNGLGFNGGGILCLNASPTITDCVVRENVACLAGAGISCFAGASPSITRCEFVNNTAMVSGGGIALDQNTVTITSCRFVGNVAMTGAGGAIGMSNASPVIRDCFIAVNSAGDAGGAIDMFASNPIIEDCRIEENDATFGGAVNVFNSSPTFRRCHLNSNTATSDGGGIRVFSGSPVLEDCILLFNDASSGGGIFENFGSTQLAGCTLAGNVATSGGGVGFGAPTSPGFVNSVFWFNTPDQIGPSGGTLTVTFSDVQGGAPGAGNINAVPLFLDLAAGDVHLATNSPCRNAGNNAAVISVTDFEGHPRVFGATVDMGADEMVPTFVGSSEDIALISTINGTGRAVETHLAGAGSLARLELSTPGGTFNGFPPFLVAQSYPAGTPPTSPFGFPEIHLNPAAAFFLFNGGAPSFLGLVALSPAPLALQYLVPTGLGGTVFRVQLIVLSPQANNGFFAASNAHDFIH